MVSLGARREMRPRRGVGGGGTYAVEEVRNLLVDSVAREIHKGNDLADVEALLAVTGSGQFARAGREGTY